MSLLKKYDTVQNDLYRYIWNRLTTCGNLNDEVIAIELVHRFPTWIMFNNVPKDAQKDICLCLIRQAKFYRANVFKEGLNGSQICSSFEQTDNGLTNESGEC